MKKLVFIILLFRLVVVYGQIDSVMIHSIDSYSDNTYSISKVSNDGEFVVSWQSKLGDSIDYDVYFQKINSEFKKVGPQIVVNKNRLFTQTGHELIMNPNGEIVVVWLTQDFRENWIGAFVQIFDKSLNPIFAVEKKLGFDSVKVGGKISLNYDSKVNEYVVSFLTSSSASNMITCVQRISGNNHSLYPPILLKTTPGFAGFILQSQEIDETGNVYIIEKVKKRELLEDFCNLRVSVLGRNNNLIKDTIYTQIWHNSFTRPVLKYIKQETRLVLVVNHYYEKSKNGIDEIICFSVSKNLNILYSEKITELNAFKKNHSLTTLTDGQLVYNWQDSTFKNNSVILGSNGVNLYVGPDLSNTEAFIKNRPVWINGRSLYYNR